MKKALYVLAALLAVGALLFVCSDFARRTDVYAGTFELSEDGKTMTLHTGKLAVEFPEDGSGARYTGEVLTDEQAAEQGYLYGVYAEIE